MATVSPRQQWLTAVFPPDGILVIITRRDSWNYGKYRGYDLRHPRRWNIRSRLFNLQLILQASEVLISRKPATPSWGAPPRLPCCFHFAQGSWACSQVSRSLVLQKPVAGPPGTAPVWPPHGAVLLRHTVRVWGAPGQFSSLTFPASPLLP